MCFEKKPGDIRIWPVSLNQRNPNLKGNRTPYCASWLQQLSFPHGREVLHMGGYQLRWAHANVHREQHSHAAAHWWELHLGLLHMLWYHIGWRTEQELTSALPWWIPARPWRSHRRPWWLLPLSVGACFICWMWSLTFGLCHGCVVYMWWEKRCVSLTCGKRIQLPNMWQLQAAITAGYGFCVC